MAAGYGYPYRRYSNYNDIAPKTDNWSKPSNASDHLCKPVIVDAEGRKHPIVSFNPIDNPETYVIETETIVKQQIHSPFVDEYKHGSHMNVEPMKDYGHVEDKWHRASSPVHGHGRPSHKVQDFLTQVQTEASKPKRFGLLSPSNWYRTPNSPGHGHGHGHGHRHGNTGHGDYKPSGHAIQNGDYDNYYQDNRRKMEPTMTTSDGWARPSPAGWAAPPDTALSRPTNDIGTAVEYLKEAARPTPVTVSPHSRLSVPITTGPKRDHEYVHTIDNRETGKRWTAPPDSALSRPTNDPVDYLKEAVRPYPATASPHSRLGVPITTGPKRDHDYGQTIDSREAAKRYGNFHSSSTPEEMYTGTIDSRTAARKYNGTTV